MADFSQAVKWIVKGHVVRRSGWLYCHRSDGTRRKEDGSDTLMGYVGFTLSDLTATDWVIAERAPEPKL